MKKSVIIPAVIIIAVCAGYLTYQYSAPQVKEHPTPEAPSQIEVEDHSSQAKVKVYRVVVKDNTAILRAVEKTVPEGKDPKEIALRQLIEQGNGKDSSNPIPEGTRLLDMKVKDGLAVVNLSREFRDNFQGGSEAEGLAIGAILRTLGQFPDIKRVRLLVEEEPLDTLGHLDLSGPLDVDWVGSEYGD